MNQHFIDYQFKDIILCINKGPHLWIAILSTVWVLKTYVLTKTYFYVLQNLMAGSHVRLVENGDLRKPTIVVVVSSV